ncbi:hypothetical protein GCM10020295_06140 [Streptomyces cinereospinus]
MATEPRWDETLSGQGIPSRTAGFPGEPQDVTGARLAAESFLRDLARTAPPATPECWHDILLVVTELAANAVQYAPGPFDLRIRRTYDGVHITVHDTSSTPPGAPPLPPGHRRRRHRVAPRADAVRPGQRGE